MTAFGAIRLPGAERLKKDEAVLVKGPQFEALLMWRPRPGEAFTITDASGAAYRARLTRLGQTDATLVCFEGPGAFVERVPEITLLQALPDRERMELIIEKTVELGVAGICPFKSERSISLAERDAKQKKSHRWQATALKAARQCRRASIPTVYPYASFEDALRLADGAALKIALWERPGITPLREALVRADRSALKRVAVLSGPEGGFEEGEMDEAASAGFVPISLGPRVLRAETAAIMAIGILGYELGI